MPLQPLVHSLSRRILSRLSQAQAKEPDPWLRDDLQIASLIVAHAARGDAVLCTPDVLASYEVLGLHPKKVWPAIQARHEALGDISEAPAVRKKPPQSVKLWCNENSVRAMNSHAGLQEGSPRTTTTVPMATASIAALYPNSDAPSSAKKSAYTYRQWLEIVRHSYVRAAVRRATLNALTARGPWPGEDGPASGVICVAFDAMSLGDEDGDGICSRRTAQRRAKLACDLKYWRLMHKFNRWLNCPKCGAERKTSTCPNEKCKYRGRSRNRDGSTNTKEFCRPYTFEIDLEKFLTATPPKYIRRFCARTWREHKEAAKRGEHPNVTEFPRKPPQPGPNPPSPAPAAPLPQREKPAAVEAPPRQPKLTRRESAKFVGDMAVMMRGAGRAPGRTEPDPDCEKCHGKGSWEHAGHPGMKVNCFCWSLPDPDYRPKMNWREALVAVCERWKRTPESVIEALKFWGYQFETEGER
jgi:hypothetical protein